MEAMQAQRSELGPFLLYLAAVSLAAMAALVAIDWHSTREFERGVLAGRQQVLKERTGKPHDCVAWWFQGDPTRADRNLTAACAARKKL
jgi:hypothetical protein